MFTGSYFPAAMFAPRYFPEVGATAAIVPTPLARIAVILFELRAFMLGNESRTLSAPSDIRTQPAPGENRTAPTPKEDRTDGVS